MDFTGLISCIKLSIIIAKCGKNSSSPTARGASGWHQPRLASIARGAGTPVPRGGLARLARAGGWHAWPGRGAGTPARAGGWHACPRGGWHAWPARGAGTPGPRGGLARLNARGLARLAGGWQGPARQAPRPSLHARAPGMSRAGGGVPWPRAGARPRPVPRGRGTAIAARGRSPQACPAREGGWQGPARARPSAQGPRAKGPRAQGPRAPGPQAPVPQCPRAQGAGAARARARACFVFDSRVFAGRKSGLPYRSSAPQDPRRAHGHHATCPPPKTRHGAPPKEQ